MIDNTVTILAFKAGTKSWDILFIYFFNGRSVGALIFSSSAALSGLFNQICSHINGVCTVRRSTNSSFFFENHIESHFNLEKDNTKLLL